MCNDASTWSLRNDRTLAAWIQSMTQRGALLTWLSLSLIETSISFPPLLISQHQIFALSVAVIFIRQKLLAVIRSCTKTLKPTLKHNMRPIYNSRDHYLHHRKMPWPNHWIWTGKVLSVIWVWQGHEEHLLISLQHWMLVTQIMTFRWFYDLLISNAKRAWDMSWTTLTVQCTICGLDLPHLSSRNRLHNQDQDILQTVKLNGAQECGDW